MSATANVLRITPSDPTAGTDDVLHARKPQDAWATDSRAVLTDLAAGRDPDTQALANVMLRLRIHVSRVFPELDADEIVQEVIVRLVERRRDVVSSKIEHPWGYLLAAARYAAIDAIRAGKRRRQVNREPLPDDLWSEDEIAALIDRDATHTTLMEALQIHVRAGDALTVRLITEWLDAAEEFGQAPSTREVAARAGVSHTSVAQALARLRATLGEVR